MSVSYMVFLKDIPTRVEWQSYLDLEQIPITLPRSLKVENYVGFVPLKLASFSTGVEIYIEDCSNLPEFANEIGDRSKAIIFRFSSDLRSACCASGAAAALAKHAGALIYCDDYLTFEEAMSEFNQFLSTVKADKGNNNHKKLLATLTKKLPSLSRKGNIFFDVPLGTSARGLMIRPDRTGNERFEVSVLLWPLAHQGKFSFCRVPTHLEIPAAHAWFLESSTGLARWSYKNACAVDEIVEFTNKKLCPFFVSIRDPKDLAEALFSQFRDTANVEDLERAGMGCAAAGKFEEAIMLLDRAVKILESINYDHATGEAIPKFEKEIQFLRRCRSVSALIREQKYTELEEQFASWRAFTVKSNGIATLDK